MFTQALKFINKLSILAALCALTACGRGTVDSSSLANPADGSPAKSIDRSYSLTYSETEGRSSLLVTFNVHGDWFTTVRLASPSELTVNGADISSQEFVSQGGAELVGLLVPVLSPFFFLASGTHYFANVPDALHTPVNIVWTDPNGAAHPDSLRVYPFTLGSAASLSRGGTFSVTVSGTPEAGGRDQYSARIDQTGNGGGAVSVIASDGSLSFSAEDLAKLSPGNATLIVERRVDFDLAPVGEGNGTASSTYQIKATLQIAD